MHAGHSGYFYGLRDYVQLSNGCLYLKRAHPSWQLQLFCNMSLRNLSKLIEHIVYVGQHGLIGEINSGHIMATHNGCTRREKKKLLISPPTVVLHIKHNPLPFTSQLVKAAVCPSPPGPHLASSPAWLQLDEIYCNKWPFIFF